MNIKIALITVFFVTIVCFNPLIGNSRCTWIVYDVIDGSTKEQTEALAYFGDCTHLKVIGQLPASETYIKLRFPIPQKIIITGTEFTFIFAPDSQGNQSQLILNKPFIFGQILLKNPILCQISHSLILTIAPNKIGACPEITVPLESQEGDWDPCAIGYQKSNWKYCDSKILRKHKGYKFISEIELTDYHNYITPLKK